MGMFGPTSGGGGSSGANQSLSNLTSQTAVNQSLAPTTDGSSDISILGSTMYRFNNITAKLVVGAGDTRFIGGNSLVELQISGASSKPTIYAYDGAGGTVGWYASAGAMYSDFGGSQGKVGLDGNGIFQVGGFARFGQSDTGAWRECQIFGGFATALPQIVSVNADFTVSNGVSVVILTWGSTAAARQITLPASVDSGAHLWIISDGSTAITAVTWVANSGQVLKSTGPAGIQINKGTHWWYYATTTGWYWLQGAT